MKAMLEGMREGKRLRRRTLPIALGSLLLGLAFDWLFYGKLPGISVFLFTAMALGTLFYFAWQFQQGLNKSVYWLAPVAIFFSLMVFVRANPGLIFINIFLVLYLLLVVAQLARQPGIPLQEYEISKYFSPVRLPIRILREAYQFVLRLLSSRNTSVPKSAVTPIIRGLILSLPLLVIFLLLLSSADLVFKHYVTSLFNPHLSPETVFRWGIIAFVTSAFMGAFALIFMPSGFKDAAKDAEKKVFELGTTEASIILGSVGALFFIFVLIQITYLFGGSGRVASTGLTYAQYARKGFFELIAVAAISLALVESVKKSAGFRTMSQAYVFKWLSGILIAEVMVIVASAHMRLNLYEDAYGFTVLRLWSHLFILWLVSAFALLAMHIMLEESEKRFAFRLFISVLSFFAVINLINTDAFIARQNIQRFANTGKLDDRYLSSLSADATPAIADMLTSPNEAIQKRGAGILYYQKMFHSSVNSHWQSHNLARDRADQIFRDNAGQIQPPKLNLTPATD